MIHVRCIDIVRVCRCSFNRSFVLDPTHPNADSYMVFKNDHICYYVCYAEASLSIVCDCTYKYLVSNAG